MYTSSNNNDALNQHSMGTVRRKFIIVKESALGFNWYKLQDPICVFKLPSNKSSLAGIAIEGS